MTFVRELLSTVMLSIVATASGAQDRVLSGVAGSEAGGSQENRWCAAWWDLPAPMSFSAAEIVCVNVLASKNTNVLVRLLPKDSSPQNAAGIVGGIRQVPQNGAIRVPLTKDYADVRQISVHGCKAAFNTTLPNESSDGALIITGVSIVQEPAQCR